MDPIRVFRKLVGHPDFNVFDVITKFDIFSSRLAKMKPDAELSELDKKIQHEGFDAWDKLLKATRDAFGVKEFSLDDAGNEVGMTDEEVFELFMVFIAYTDEVKKNIGMTPTSQPSTEPKS